MSSRPILRWHGGKWLLAPWIISNFPSHRTYTEAFGGAASVLLRKPRCYSEVYNDLDGDVVNLFRVLQVPKHAERLHHLLKVTPFARMEMMRARKPTKDRIERARRLIIRSFMGFGSNGHNGNIKTGFRANSNRSGTTPAHDWMHYPDCIPQFVKRWGGVVVENRPAVEGLLQHDAPDTLHYIDPPYPHSTRGDSRGDYSYEMGDEDHVALAEVLRDLAGMVVLSGYPCDLYDKNLYKDWTRVEKKAMSDGAKVRTEVLWFNEAARKAKNDGQLFR